MGSSGESHEDVLCMPVSDDDLIVDDDVSGDLDPAEATMITHMVPELDTIGGEPLPERRAPTRGTTEIGPPSGLPQISDPTADDAHSDTFAAFTEEPPITASESVPDLDLAQDRLPDHGFPDYFAGDRTLAQALPPPASEIDELRDAIMPPPPPIASELPGSSRELIELKKERNEKQREVLELRRKLHEKELERLQWQDREADIDARQVEVHEKVARLEQANAALRAERSAADTRHARLEKEAADVRQELKRKIGEQTMREAELESQVQKLSSDFRSRDDEVRQLSARLATRERERADAHIKVSDLEITAASQQDEIERLSGELHGSQVQLTTLRHQLDALLTESTELQDSTAQLQRELSTATGQRDATRQSLEDSRARLEAAKEHIRSDERNRAKAMRALEVFLGILRETGYDPDGD